jgi:crotonobetainyl-CoA:carnitine CoA-transferase CaiB-like acyl-CoA transferase
MPRIQGSSALARFRVLDLTRVRAGPSCVRQLADFGADVVKIEATKVEDMGGPRDGPDFQNLHRNKRSITLNLKDPKGREVFFRLVKNADVVVENFRPDVKDRLGIDYESLRKVNRRIVLASVSGFGQDGPYRERPGFDQIAQGLSGIMSVTGQPGGGPMRVGCAVADVGGGLLAALGILTALLEREVSGEGQWVQSSLLQAAIQLLDFQAARYTMLGEVADQQGNDHPTSMPTSAYKTADGYMNVAASGSQMWKRLCQVLEKPELFDHPDYADADGRARNRKALNAAIEKQLVRKTTAEWTEILNRAGIPSGPIYRMDQVFADPQVKHLGVAVEVESPKLGKYKIINQPVKLSRTPAKLVTATPERGAHTDEVLREAGFDDAAIADLRKQGII